MGNEIVQVDYAALEQVSQRFSRNAEAAAALQRQVERSANALRQGGWQGRGAGAFFAELDGVVLPSVQRLASALQQGSVVTHSIIQIMQQAEEEASHPFHGNAEIFDAKGEVNPQPTPEIDVDGWLGWIQDKINTMRQEVNDIVDKGSELLKRAEFIIKKLSEVQWSDVVDTEGLEGDWLGLFSVWFFETSLENLGVWSDLNGTPLVTITNPSYINDLKNKPNYTEALNSLKTTYPNMKIGDSINYPFRFTGPGTTTGDYNAVEWFLGSYTTTVTVTGIDPVTGDVTVSVRVLNQSHWESGTRLPQQFQDVGLPDYLIHDSPRDTFGPGGNFYQEFIWEDIIPNAG